MPLIPKQDRLKEAMEMGDVLQEFRPYIGMSSLNGKCMRRTWYNFRWSCDRYVSKRVDRIFKRGDLEEARVIKDLREAGVKVTSCLEDQIELTDDTGHIKGHPDGVADNVPTAEKTTHLLEIKTMKHSLYTAYLKNGLEKSNPSYWGQIHTYMGELGLKRGLFIVTNKDNEERDYNRIKYDESVHKECMSNGLNILMSEFPPKKIGEVTWYECKMCACKGICHRGEPIKKTCRSCKHVNIEMEGDWSCELYQEWLSYKDQMKACVDYELSEVYEL